MSYIRTENGIYDITGKIIKDTYYGLKENEVYIGLPFKQADAIEELICEGDLVRIWGTLIEVHHVDIDTNKVPHIYDNAGYRYSINNIAELYIKQSNKNYKLTAVMNEKRKLELL